MKYFLEVKNVCKSYKTNSNKNIILEVLNNINLKITKGEFVTLFGPNGCGKTTLLYTIGGLLSIDNGTILINQMAPSETKIGFIFQNYDDSLLPWKNAKENIMFPLIIHGINKKEREIRFSKLMDELKIDIPLDQYPYQLSGGQKQLCAIARAIIYEPDILLMDEPFASLDYQVRISLQDTLLAIWEKYKLTILFVSHEIEEAIYLADKILMLNTKPTNIRKIVKNNLAYPRSQDIKHSKEFIHIKKNIISIFSNIIDN